MPQKDEELKCEQCQSTKGVTIGPDPFVQEIYDKEVIVTLCEDCYHEACMDI
jgi:hypothetical protein